jgi:hypothetical protein
VALIKSPILCLQNNSNKNLYTDNEKEEIRKIDKKDKTNKDFCKESLSSYYDKSIKFEIKEKIKINDIEFIHINDDYGCDISKKHIISEPIFEMYDDDYLDILNLETRISYSKSLDYYLNQLSQLKEILKLNQINPKSKNINYYLEELEDLIEPPSIITNINENINKILNTFKR